MAARRPTRSDQRPSSDPAGRDAHAREGEHGRGVPGAEAGVVLVGGDQEGHVDGDRQSVAAVGEGRADPAGNRPQRRDADRAGDRRDGRAQPHRRRDRHERGQHRLDPPHRAPRRPARRRHGPARSDRCSPSLPRPTPLPVSPMARPRRDAWTADPAIPGAGTQIIAPPKPARTIPTTRTGTDGASARTDTPGRGEQQAQAHRRRRRQAAGGEADEQGPREVRGEVQRAEQPGDGVRVDEIGVQRGQQQRVPEAPEALGHGGGHDQDRDEHPWPTGGAALPRDASTERAHRRSVGRPDGGSTGPTATRRPSWPG